MDLKKLFEIWKQQSKNKHKILRVEEDFYEKVAEEIKKAEEEIKEIRNLEFEDVESFEKLFLRKEKQILELKKLVERIFKLRTLILLNVAFKYSEGEVLNVKVDGLSKEEKKFFEELLLLIREYRSKVLKKVLKGEKPEYFKEEKEKNEEYWIVAAKDYIPQFIGSDLRIYGPFEPEEVFSLPKDTAEVLSNKDKIKIIKKL